MSPRGTQPMEGAVHDVRDSTTLGGGADARAGRCQRRAKEAEFMTLAKTMRTKRC